jgi:excisionase family DNA binding protein
MSDIPPEIPTELAFTIPEVVAAAKMPRTAVYLALQQGQLEAKKSGRRTLILREELKRYLANLPDYRAVA